MGRREEGRRIWRVLYASVEGRAIRNRVPVPTYGAKPTHHSSRLHVPLPAVLSPGSRVGAARRSAVHLFRVARHAALPGDDAAPDQADDATGGDADDGGAAFDDLARAPAR